MSRIILKKFTLALLLILSVVSLGLPTYSQSNQSPSLIPYRKGYLWGFADQNRQVVIQPVFDEVSFFRGNWAIVKKDQKTGVINRKGTFLIEPKYKELSYQGNNFFFFRNNNQSGYIDTLGQEIADPYKPFPELKFYVSKNGKPNPEMKLSGISGIKKDLWEAEFNDSKGRTRVTLVGKDGRDLLPGKYILYNRHASNTQKCYIISSLPRYKWPVGSRAEFIDNQKLRFGLLNENLELKVPVRFRSIEFENNFLIVWDWFNKAGLWDYTTGRKLTRRRFDQIKTTRKPARATVRVLGKQGLIDSLGNYIIPLDHHTIRAADDYTNFQDYKSLGLYYPYVFHVTNAGETKIVDPFGKPLKAFSHGLLRKISDSLYLVRTSQPETNPADPGHPKQSTVLGIMDLQGNMLVEPLYKTSSTLPQNKLVILSNDTLSSYFTNSGKHLATRRMAAGKPSRTGTPSLSPKTVSGSDLAAENRSSCFYLQQQLPVGYSIVGNTCLYSTKSYGVIDNTGKVIIPFHYNLIYPLSATTLAVKQAKKWGVLQRDGKVILPVVYDQIVDLEGSTFLAGETNLQNFTHSYLYDSTGAILFPHKIWRHEILHNKNAKVHVEGGEAEIDLQGKVISWKPVIPHRTAVPGEPGIYQVNDFGWSFIDLQGNTVIPREYSEIKPFKEGLAPVAKNGLWGYIDKKNKVVIPFQFEAAEPFSDGKAVVRTGKGWQVITRNGKLLALDQYDYIKPFSEGMAAVSSGRRWGFINEKGTLIIPCKYTEVSEFRNGMAAYSLFGGYGFINKKGTQVLPPLYQNYQPFQNGFGWVQKNKWYKINRQGQVIDSVNTKVFENPKTTGKIRFENKQLYRQNPDGSETLLGTFGGILNESEGLIGVSSIRHLYYYVDEKGNRFLEED